MSLNSTDSLLSAKHHGSFHHFETMLTKSPFVESCPRPRWTRKQLYVSVLVVLSLFCVGGIVLMTSMVMDDAVPWVTNG